MTKNPKKYIAKEFTNHISYRALTTYERRNPSMFSLSNSAHDTWEAAHEWLVEKRRERLAAAKKELASAERRLAKALAMTPKEAA